MGCLVEAEKSQARAWLWALAVSLAAAIYFGYGLAAEPPFTDESAYIYHSYYYRLLREGQWNHPDWLHLAAYDSPPLFKYLIGLSLEINGYQVPATIGPAEQWYQRGTQLPADQNLLWSARVPMYLGAVAGVAAMFLLGWLLHGVTAGVLAAVLLATSPLYFTHARRAMGDDLCMALMMLAFVGFMVSSRRHEQNRYRVAVLFSCLTGLCLGLAAATKLTGLEAGAAFGVTGGLAALWDWRQQSFWFACRKACLTVFPATLVMVTLFVGCNPYFWASPRLPDLPVDDRPLEVAGTRRTAEWLAETRRLANLSMFGRFEHMLHYRTEALNDAKELFPDDVLKTVPQRITAIVVEGLGRWTSGGKEPITRRIQLPEGQSIRQAGVTSAVPPVYWCVVPLLLGSIGFIKLISLAKEAANSRSNPMYFLVPVVWAATDIVLLSRNLTLNWDRYFMSVVCYGSLFAALGIATMLRLLVLTRWRHSCAGP